MPTGSMQDVKDFMLPDICLVPGMSQRAAASCVCLGTGMEARFARHWSSAVKDILVCCLNFVFLLVVQASFDGHLGRPFFNCNCALVVMKVDMIPVCWFQHSFLHQFVPWVQIFPQMSYAWVSHDGCTRSCATTEWVPSIEIYLPGS